MALEDAGLYYVSAIIISICAAICAYFAGYTVHKVATHDESRTFSSGNVLYLTLAALILFSIQTIIAIFDPLLTVLEVEESKVDYFSNIALVLYFSGKIITNLLFTQRLKFVFSDFTLKYNNYIIHIIYGILIVQFISILGIWIGQIHNEKNESKDKWDNALGNGAGSLYYICDLILSILLPYLFIRKLYQLLPIHMVRLIDSNTSNHEIKHQPTVTISHQNTQSNNQIEMNNHHNDNKSTEIVLNTQRSIDISNNKTDDKRITVTNAEASQHSHHSNNDGNESSGEHNNSSNIQSVPAIGVTSTNAPVNMNTNEYKYEQILNTATRITLLCLWSSVTFIIVILAFIATNGQNGGVISIGDACIKIDSAVQCACIALCYKWSDSIYVRLCNPCHNYFKEKRCCACCC